MCVMSLYNAPWLAVIKDYASCALYIVVIIMVVIYVQQGYVHMFNCARAHLVPLFLNNH